ncbi:Lipoprotein-releasing system ATP-binding protein LolD [Exiguobacterium sp. 8H]|uniref:ABC transporter ATP-binding protein n=1 Tax=Exiguobacterium TaxID=33986 RepID=UPI0012F43996|nr:MULTISPECIES: ABC transporter ATP-binding protein [Exiguobacterium]VXB23567.1 Lipoprotein-releasing system ATP-binding protein LolD [Exiguobacterium sp. 8H]VXB24270.1 Lipoprotein-releasing system ATP-binding protein LolD [Exiguobacterium sp. 8A]
MRLSHVSHQFDGQLVLNDIELHVSPGECVAIVGPSGSGKSTLLYILGLLRKPDQGAFLMNERDVFELDEEQRRLLRLHEVGFVFQQAHLIPYLTVLEQLELIQEKRQMDAKQLLSDLGLGHRLHHLPSTLSGGEKQRVAVARALINSPQLILADEPTASLDYENGRRVMELLAKQAHEEGRRVVVITHDERMLDVCDRVLRVIDGTLTELNKEEGHHDQFDAIDE